MGNIILIAVLLILAWAARALFTAWAAVPKAPPLLGYLRLVVPRANYNQKVAASLSPTLIQQQWITRWDGNLPTYMFGNGSGVMLQLPIPQQKVAER